MSAIKMKNEKKSIYIMKKNQPKKRRKIPFIIRKNTPEKNNPSPSFHVHF